MWIIILALQGGYEDGETDIQYLVHTQHLPLLSENFFLPFLHIALFGDHVY